VKNIGTASQFILILYIELIAFQGYCIFMNHNPYIFAFNSAIKESFCKKKALIMYPSVFFCGLLVIFCKILSLHSLRWIGLSLFFLPFFVSSGLVLASGILVSKIYRNTGLKRVLNIKNNLINLLETLAGIAYLTLPILLFYLLLWVALGIFYLLQEIPKIGGVFGALFSFGPFLLVLGSLLLVVLTLFFFFFVTPHIAFGQKLRFKIALDVFRSYSKNIFVNTGMFLLALLPVLLSLSFLSLAAVLTSNNYGIETNNLSLGLQWFFIMIPFCMCLIPGILFFFNFSVEIYKLTFSTTQVNA